MQEKKKQYILDNLLRIILAMFVLTVLFAFSCLLLSHGAHGIWLAVLALFVLLGVLGGVFLRRCLRIIQKTNRSCSSMPQVIPSQTYVTWNVISVREPRWR